MAGFNEERLYIWSLDVSLPGGRQLLGIETSSDETAMVASGSGPTPAVANRSTGQAEAPTRKPDLAKRRQHAPPTGSMVSLMIAARAGMLR